MPLVFGRSILGFAVVADTGVTWTNPDLSSASYDSVSFSVATQETTPMEIVFKPDGTKMYTVGRSGDAVDEYDLSTAWDVSTASHVQDFSISGQESQPAGLFFKPDGTKMYITGFFGDDVNEYSLSTAWNISTASYSQNFSIASQEGNPQDVVFKSDGTKMYICAADGDKIISYSLSTAWDISTASWDGLSEEFSITSQESNPRGMFIGPNGLKLFVTGNGGASPKVTQYTMSTAWDISSASYDSVSFSVSSQDSSPEGIAFKSDGSKMYIVGNANNTVYQYST